MKVYLVTRGSYSDYSVQAVFADKALAEAHRLELSESNEVDEYEVVEHAPQRINIYNVSNDTYHGNDVRHEWSYPAWDYNRPNYKRVEVVEYNSRSGFHAVRVTGLDQKAVRKAYDDRMAQHKAQEAGIA